MSGALNRVFKGEGGRTAFEAAIAALLIFLLLFVAAERYYSTITPARERTLVVELANLRRAVTYYEFLNGRLPASLKELAASDMIITKKNIEGSGHTVVVVGKYVEAMELDKEGYPTDPFGNRFSYRPDDGKVSSSTSGYEGW